MTESMPEKVARELEDAVCDLDWERVIEVIEYLESRVAVAAETARSLKTPGPGSSDNKSRVILLRGIPGCGFDEFLEKVRVCHKVTVFSARDFLDPELSQVPSSEKKDRLTASHGECFKAFYDHLSQPANRASGEIVIVRNTNLSSVDLSPYVMAAKSHGYDYQIITLITSAKKAMNRGVPGHIASRYLMKMSRNKIPSFWPHMFIKIMSTGEVACIQSSDGDKEYLNGILTQNVDPTPNSVPT